MGMFFKRAWRFLRKYWWVFLSVLAAVAGVVIAILSRDRTTTPPGLIKPTPKTFKERAQEQVERIQLEGEIERARIQTKAESENADLDEIERIGNDDPVEGRKRLAEWLRANL